MGGRISHAQNKTGTSPREGKKDGPSTQVRSASTQLQMFSNAPGVLNSKTLISVPKFSLPVHVKSKISILILQHKSIQRP